MARKTKETDSGAPDQAQFLFRGTVVKTGASTLAQVPKHERTAIVHVDEIMHAPPALARTLGKQITVKLAAGASPKTGDQLLFHANSWLFGDSVAVEALKQEKPPAVRPLLAEAHMDPTAKFKQQALEQRVADSDLVVEGEVSSVHLPESESVAAVRARGQNRPLSEHDPKWREAVVDVHAVHKGNSDAKHVVVRFPSSTDVQWFRAPKFRPGDRGVFMLQQPAQAPSATAAKLGIVAAAQAAPVYTALHPLDFQPADKVDAVGPAIRAAVAKSTPRSRE